MENKKTMTLGIPAAPPTPPPTRELTVVENKTVNVDRATVLLDSLAGWEAIAAERAERVNTRAKEWMDRYERLQRERVQRYG